MVSSRITYTSDLAKLRGVSFATYNVRSMVRKHTDIQAILLRSELNVLCLTETWLNQSIDSLELAIPGYTLHRLDRGHGITGKGGGGLIIYTNSKYDFQHIDNWSVGNDDIEIMWVKLNLKLTRPTLVANIYRPPSGSVNRFIDIIEQKLLDISTEVEGEYDLLLMGDMNLNYNSRTDSSVKQYKEFLKRAQLTCLNMQPTRITNTTRSNLDHILTNRKDLYLNCNTVDPGLSDHQMVFVSRKRKKLKRGFHYVDCRSFRHFNPEEFQNDVENADWDILYECTDVNVAANILCSTLVKIIDKHAPFTKLKLRDYAPPWLNTEFLGLVDTREFWSNKYKKNPNEYNLMQREIAKVNAKELKEQLQQSYFEDQIDQSNGDSKKLWKIIKEFWPTKPKGSHINKINEHTIDIDKANELNTHFSTIGIKLSKQIESSGLRDIPVTFHPPIFDFTTVELLDIANAIRDMRPSTSCGMDGLTPRLLKQCGPGIYKPLLHVVNLSFRQSMFPDSWKTGCITPLYKENDATLPSNYRPISILPSLSKILERLAHSQIYEYLSVNKMLTKEQAGFRKGHSTGTCLMDFLANIYNNIDMGNFCGVLFLDLRKAFDTVDHAILVSKLRSYGFKSSSAKWVNSYLCGRLQVTRVGREISRPMLVDCGVPQGSILGPLLFSVYVNDLPQCLNMCKTNLYADDTALTIVAQNKDNLECIMNNTLDEVFNWFKINRLSLNCAKSKIVCFGTRPRLSKCESLNVECDGINLEQVTSYKYLGVMIDSSLSFNENTEYIYSKVIKRLGVLGRSRYFLSQELALYLYKQLILPLIDYGDVFYDGTSQKNSIIIQKLQNAALRRILKAPQLTSTAGMHEDLSMDKLHVRREKHICTEMYKIVHELYPRGLMSNIQMLEQVSSRVTRQSSALALYVKKPRLELTKRSFFYRGPILWNKLPVYLQQAPTLECFKKLLNLWYEKIT